MISNEENKSQAQINDLSLNKNGFLTVSEYTICNFFRWKHISFGCKPLDSLTNGGILASGITEISGEAGIGKTQICIQLSLMVQLPEEYGGFEKGTAYICTEHPFPSQRAKEIQESIQSKFPVMKNHDFINNIHIQQVSNWDKLITSIENDLISLLQQRSIGLIIIDSIAGVLRTIEKNYVNRSFMMKSLVHKLLEISTKFECAILCINQVSSFQLNGKSVTVPALGLAWQKLINTRIFLSKDLINDKFKKMEIHFSPYLDKKSEKFKVTSEGIVEAS